MSSTNDLLGDAVKAFPAEPHIIINGRALTTAQAMTLRVALSHFASEVRENGLGEDDLGKSIAGGYIARAAEIESLMSHGSQ